MTRDQEINFVKFTNKNEIELPKQNDEIEIDYKDNLYDKIYDKKNKAKDSDYVTPKIVRDMTL